MKSKRICSILLCLMLLFLQYPQNVLASQMSTITIAAPAHNSATNNNLPVYSGTADPNSKLLVWVNADNDIEITANQSGNWSFTQAYPLPDGYNSFYASALDSYGNVIGTPQHVTILVDTTPPPPPVVASPANGSGTNDTAPAITGVAEPSNVVTIYIDGSSQGTATADSGGNWSFTPSTPLADGSHTVRAKSKDPAGNDSIDSNTNTFTVDATPPASPTVITPPNGSITSNDTPSISGTGEAGSRVTILVDGSSIGDTTVSGMDAWLFSSYQALAQGPHTVYAYATDAYNNQSGNSSVNTFTVDTIPPEVPVVTFPENGGGTNDNAPTIAGTAEVNSLVTIVVDNAVQGTTTADGAGSWSFTQPTPLAEGSHSVKATATDEVGNTSQESNPISFTVDTAAPAAPVVLTPSNGVLTKYKKPAISGTAEALSLVTIYVENLVIGTVSANASGDWTFSPSADLSDGANTVKATATDEFGNTSPFSDGITFTVDSVPPPPPVITSPANGSSTMSNTLTIAGTAEAHSTVAVYVDGGFLRNVSANGSGNWSTQSNTLSEGSHQVVARASDLAMNVGSNSTIVTFTVDTTPPAAPVVISPANGSGTNDNTPTISGTAEPYSSVSIVIVGVTQGTTTADGAGNWSFTVPYSLHDDIFYVRARATDEAGNTGAFSNDISFTVDTDPPSEPSVSSPGNDNVLGNNVPMIYGSAQSNCTVTIILDGSTIGTAVANQDGLWEFDYFYPSPLSDGSHTLQAVATDEYGNTSSSTNTFTVDTTPPAKPVVTFPQNGSSTKNNPPSITGTAEPGADITILIDNQYSGTTSADGSGHWSFTLPGPLADGSHAIRASATDAVLNNSGYSDPLTFTVDTVPPAVPVVVTLGHGSITNNATPVITGTAENGSMVCVILDGAMSGTTTADGSGFWSYAVASTLTDGSHTVKAFAEDAAGNISGDSNTLTFAVDTTPPQVPVITSPAGSSLLNDNTPSFSGTAEANSTVSIYINDILRGTVTATQAGSFRFTLPSALADGLYSLIVASMDAAGNSVSSSLFTFTVDTDLPSVPVITAPAPGTMISVSSPLITGTAEALSTVHIELDSVYVGSAAADAQGNWAYTPTSMLVDGTHVVRAKARDAAGNESQFCENRLFTVDTTLPVSIAGLEGLTAPVKAAAPVTHIKETSEYTGIVVWSPADAVFKPGTVYTATITLQLKPNYAVRSIPANFFTTAGAVLTNAAGSGVIHAVFPATQPPVSAQLNPASLTYSQSDVWTQITLNDAQSVTGVYQGINALSKDSYALNGNTLIIRHSYLSGLGLKKGETLSLLVRFSEGADTVLTVIKNDNSSTTWQVVFNNEANDYAMKAVTDGTSIGTANWPANPTRNNYTFGGWYTEQSGRGSVFTANTVVTKDTTVYAKWTAVALNDGQGSPLAPSVLLNNAPTSLFALLPDPGTPGLIVITNQGSLSVLQRPGQQLFVIAPMQQFSMGNVPPPVAPFFPSGTPPGPAGTVYDHYVAFSFSDSLIGSQTPGGILNFQSDSGSIALPSNVLAGSGTQAGAGNAMLTIMSGRKSEWRPGRKSE